jgi:hypothetical protein
MELHLPDWTQYLEDGDISRAIEYQGDLILAGDFTLELAVLEKMVRWTGTSFETFDQDFYIPPTGFVSDLELFDGTLMAFGWMQSSNFPGGILEFDGVRWQDFFAGRVEVAIDAATVHDGMLYVAGDFTEIQGVTAAGIARWTGSTWESLADTAPAGRVRDMLFFNGQLYLAGEFTEVDGVPSLNIARWYPPLAVDVPPLERQWKLRLSAAPNPFNPQTTLHFELRGGAEARLDIYDLAGRRVWGTSLRSRGEGPSRWTWNGRDESGRELASGVYFVRLREGNQEQRIRITLLK